MGIAVPDLAMPQDSEQAEPDMSSRRLVRVSELLRAEVCRLISRERSLEDTLITVTHIEVSPDLRNAFVYFTLMNPDFSEQSILSQLEKLSQNWQRTLGSRMKTKNTPRLHFRIDEVQRRGDRIMEILDSLQKPEGPASE